MKVFALFLIACLVLGGLLWRRSQAERYAAMVGVALVVSMAYYGFRML